MSVTAAKICLVGDFGVGKTSLVNRFVKQAFSERYQTTVGVTIETLEVRLDANAAVKLIIWDIAGSNVIDTVKKTYLRGAAGLLFVADGTRRATFDAVLSLEQEALAVTGAVPCAILLNKRDLTDHWELEPACIEQLAGRWPVFETSARTGVGVETAFTSLAATIAAGTRAP